MGIELKGFQKISPARQVIIVAVVAGGLFALAWFQLITPLMADVDQKKITHQALLQQNAKSETQLQQFAKLKQESEDLQVELDRLKQDLPLEKETHEILEDIQKKISGSHLRIVRVGPRSTVDQEYYTEWPWDIEIVGSYHNLGTFLDKIRNLPRIVSVNNIKISARPTSGPEAQLTNIGATYTATTYVYRDEPGPEAQTAKK